MLDIVVNEKKVEVCMVFRIKAPGRFEWIIIVHHSDRPPGRTGLDDAPGVTALRWTGGYNLRCRQMSVYSLKYCFTEGPLMLPAPQLTSLHFGEKIRL